MPQDPPNDQVWDARKVTLTAFRFCGIVARIKLIAVVNLCWEFGGDVFSHRGI